MKNNLLASLLVLSCSSVFSSDLSRPRAMINPTVLATIDAITIERVGKKAFIIRLEQEEITVTATDHCNQFFYDKNKSFRIHVGSHSGPIVISFCAPPDNGLSADTSRVLNTAREEFFSK